MPLEDRRQLPPLVYIPETACVVQETHSPIAPKEEEPYTPKEPDIKSPIRRETQDSHASAPHSNSKGKLFAGKHRNLRGDKPLYKPRPLKGRGDRDKRKRSQKHFEDARECINRNRTMRETERQVRISHRSKSPSPVEGERPSRGGKRSPRGDRSPKRVVVKKERSISSDNQEREQLELKLEPINGDQTSETETYMFIEEAN